MTACLSHPCRPLRRASLPALAVAVAALPAALSAQARPRPGTIGGAGLPPARGPVTPAPSGSGSADRAPAMAAAPDTGRRMAVMGVVYDSLAGAPLSGATVQFVSEANRARVFSTLTDSLGRYRIPGVHPGRYLAGFLHPDLDALGIELRPLVVDLMPDTAAQVDLGVPDSRTLLPALCGDNAPAGRRATTEKEEVLSVLLQPKPPAALTGSVRDATTGEALQGAKVVITWKELKPADDKILNVSRRFPARVRADGGFVACGLPADVDLVASAEMPGRRTGLIDLQLTPGRLERRDFLLGDSATTTVVTLPDTAAAREGRLAVPITVARGHSRLTGVVRTPDGRPVAGATVLVWGTDVTGRTSPNGTFTLSGLPAGTYSLEVRAIGYAPKRVAVNLTAVRPVSVAVALDQRAHAIQGVVVQADRTKLEKDYTGFLDRSKHGMGHYLTEDQIAQRSAIQFTDVLRTTPGLRVVPNGAFGYTLQGRGNCTPDVYLDGMPIIDGASSLDDLVKPQDVAGVEVYNGGATTPVQFQNSTGGGSCGAVVIWSKRGKPATTGTE